MFVVLGILVVYIYSLYVFYMNNFSGLFIYIMDFFWELVILILIMLLGYWIEMNVVGNVGNVLKKMVEFLFNIVVKLIDNN